MRGGSFVCVGLVVRTPEPEPLIQTHAAICSERWRFRWHIGGILRIPEGLTSEQLALKVRKEMKRNLPAEFRKLAKVRRALGETR